MRIAMAVVDVLNSRAEAFTMARNLYEMVFAMAFLFPLNPFSGELWLINIDLQLLKS